MKVGEWHSTYSKEKASVSKITFSQKEPIMDDSERARLKKSTIRKPVL